MSPLILPSPPSLFASLSVLWIIQDDGQFITQAFSWTWHWGRILLHPKGTQPQGAEGGASAHLCEASQRLHPLLWFYKQGRAFCCKNQSDCKEKGLPKAQSGPWTDLWVPLMSCNHINYCLHGLTSSLHPVTSLSHQFYLLKNPGNTKTFKTPHPDSNIMQEVRHFWPINCMQAIRTFFQSSAENLINPFV